MKFKFCISMITVCTGLGLAGCKEEIPPSSNKATTEEVTTQEVKTDYPTYTMAVERSFPPFVEPDQYGVPSGFDIDLIKAIGEKSKFNVNIQTIEWRDAFDGLKEGKYQIVGSDVGITAERKELSDFSGAYLEGYTTFATTNPNINSKSDISNLKIAVQSGNYYMPKIVEQNGENNTLVEFETFFLACQKVIQGEADVCVEDTNLIEYFKTTYEGSADINMIHTFPAFESEKKQIAFAISKENTQLTAVIDDGLKKIKADGTYDSIYRKWFGK